MDNPEVVLFQTLQVGADLLKQGEIVSATLGGTSMFPFLRPGDVAHIHAVPISVLERGQVIVFQADGKWIAHRLVVKQEVAGLWQLLTQGDSATKADPLISEAQYLGVVKGVNRNGKTHKINKVRHKIYGQMMCVLRPVPHCFLRLTVRIKNRIARF